MNRWFQGVFEARAFFWLAADRLYRIYWTEHRACFIRIGGQRLFPSGPPPLIALLLRLVQRYNPRLAEALGDKIAQWGEGRGNIDTAELDQTAPDELLRQHPHNFAIDLDQLNRTVLQRSISPPLWGEHLGVFRFQDGSGFDWRLLLEEDSHFVTAVGLLPRLLGARLEQDTFIRQASAIPSLQFLLGRGFQSGINLPVDITEAVDCFRRSALQGYAPAQCQLGVLYQQGEALPRDGQLALEWCQRAVEQDYPPALTLMGDFYQQGQGVAQDIATAVQWYQRAAEQNDSHAMFLLAEKYENGQGVLRNYQEAKSWYSRAAEQGYVAAQLALAKLLVRGLGVPRDYYHAAYWFHRAALQDNPEAQYGLGELYETGHGVSRNEAMAVRWYVLASQQDYPPAREAISRLREKGIAVVPAPFRD